MKESSSTLIIIDRLLEMVYKERAWPHTPCDLPVTRSQGHA